MDEYILQALEEGATNLECLADRMKELGWIPPAPFYKVQVKIAINALVEKQLVGIDFTDENDPLIWRRYE